MLFIQLHGKDIALDQTVRPHIPVSVDMGMNGAPFCNKDNFNEVMRVQGDVGELGCLLQHGKK